jgi:hypothetical protein
LEIADFIAAELAPLLAICSIPDVTPAVFVLFVLLDPPFVA